MKRPSKVGESTSKGASSTSNSQNIQSKLLGASVSEISIEKFRSLSQQPVWYALGGRLNHNILKSISNKFCSDLIFVLDLSGQQLTNIDVLSECIHLIILNLKNNQIKDLFSLQKLDDLMFLSVACNQVHSLDYLGSLKQLTNLQAQQNNLKSVKSVQALERCVSLKTLYFKTFTDQTSKNPLCDLDDYRRIILQTFPQLSRLDGVQTTIMHYNTGKELSKYVKSSVKVELGSNTGSWYTQRFPTVDLSVKMESETQFNQVNTECKQLCSTIEMKLKLLQY